MNKAIILFLLAVLYPAFIFAQTGKLKGTVKDSIGNPIEAATIFLKETGTGATSDAHGNYLIENIAPGNYSLAVRIIGYNSVSVTYTIKANETSVLNFTLSPQAHLLNELKVMGTPSVNGMGHLKEAQDGIIYSGKKTEVLVLDSMDANTAQNNPREVLGRIPGSNYSETEGGGFPSNGIALRGLRPTQSIEMQTRQDGYNIAADLYGYPETYYMPPLEALDRIEVIRGESSLQWGPQFGGVINFIIKDPPADKPFQFTVQLTGGSYEFFDAYISMGGTYKKFSYYMYCQPKYSLGFRPNSDVSQVSAFARVEYKFSKKFKLGAEYTLLRNRIHMAGGLDDAEFDQNPDQSVRARNWLKSPWNIGALTGLWNISDKTLLSFKSALNISARDLVWRNEDGGIQTLDTINPATNSYSPREVEHEGFTSVTTEVRVLTHYNILGVEQTLAVGIRYFQGYMSRQEGGPGSTGSDFNLNLYGGNYANNLNFSTINIAPFVENTFHIGKIVSITPGFRFEYIESTAKGYITDPNTSAIVNVDLHQYWEIPLAGCGIQIKTTPTTNVYANFSQCYEPTNYSNLTPLGSTSVIDPNLKDVSGFNSDLGWRGNISNILNFDVGAFYMPFNKEIGIETLNNSQGNHYTYVTNVGNALHTGLETYVEVNPFKNSSKYKGWGRISVFNSYSFDHSYYTSGPFKGNVEEMAPLNIERAGLNYSYKIFSTTFIFSYSTKSFADANNTVYSPDDATVGIIPAYFVMDWSSSFHIKNYNIKLGISNLTGTKYFNLRTDEYPGPGIIPAPPRSIYIGFGAKF
jgi:Fe(3+) dicitrate transport protein